ncbi:hypothetical protein [Alkalihalobacillus sp. AL-G]|uniref:hypothetical protein n=1 Tax=Alkalihalobacillus sp. AL-G TaxID=2926399 RepID=UPI00272D2AF5|nr:hypothetical protein [Alkalihalobacillus sp. AL-G]WLD91713.1 hypothetical protein MOJ78_11730 [Alkalihalobacillus sp. AL-G]
MAILTIPKAWRELQPVEGWIMLGAFVFFNPGYIERKTRKQESRMDKKELFLSLTGVVSIVLGAYFTVRSAENILTALGVSEIVGGIFIVGTLCTAPEVFITWQIVGSGRPTSGSTSVTGDKAITMTLGFFPAF